VTEALPSPLDGLVHQVRTVETDRGSRTIQVRCGATMPTYRSHERLAGATIWGTRVTCPSCRGEPADG
jgi:hypothetical protein